jgi:pilus assembly protein CpaB
VRRRLLAACAALVLAVIGAGVLLAYARGADARAMAGVQTVSVLVVDKPIAQGTPADEVKDLVRSELLPAKAVAPGRVTDLNDLAGEVATGDLEPGEQLLASRFSSPDKLRAPGTVAVPAGDEEVSVRLEPQRAMGGRLAAGDKVGVFLSMKKPDGSGVTHQVLHGVLVTQVQGGTQPAQQSSSSGSSSDGSSGGNVTVTFGVTARQAEAIVFGQEHGTLWLSLEPAGAKTGGTTVLDPGNIYTEAFQ